MRAPVLDFETPTPRSQLSTLHHPNRLHVLHRLRFGFPSGGCAPGGRRWRTNLAGRPLHRPENPRAAREGITENSGGGPRPRGSERGKPLTFSLVQRTHQCSAGRGEKRRKKNQFDLIVELIS